MACEHCMTCPACGDKLIHQSNRGSTESSSEYGQHIFDSYQKNFFWMDVDGIIYKRNTGIMRIIEHKTDLGATLRPSQKTVLPMLAKAIDFLIVNNIISAGSGVFFVRSAPPWKHAVVRKIGSTTGDVLLDGERLKSFETGLVVFKND